MEIAIVILCHKRTTHLAEVINSLEKVSGIEYCKIIFVAHSASQEVLDIVVNSKLTNSYLHRIDHEFSSAKSAINHSTYTGCNIAFSDPNVDFCIVLEDDIVVAKNILEFSKDILEVHKKRRKFRGINFYSIDTQENLVSSNYVRLNYSFGWGWLIPRKTFMKLNFWTGKEDSHWDYFIEPYIRTGYLIAPVHSKIRNIGFDETATHTSNDSFVGEKISQSYDISTRQGDQRSVREASGKYEVVRWDCIVLSNLPKLYEYKLLGLRKISYLLYRWALLGFKRVHFVWRGMRNRIDVHFAEISRECNG